MKVHVKRKTDNPGATRLPSYLCIDCSPYAEFTGRVIPASPSLELWWLDRDETLAHSQLHAWGVFRYEVAIVGRRFGTRFLKKGESCLTCGRERPDEDSFNVYPMTARFNCELNIGSPHWWDRDVCIGIYPYGMKKLPKDDMQKALATLHELNDLRDRMEEAATGQGSERRAAAGGGR